jgi:hypothetical protein
MNRLKSTGVYFTSPPPVKDLPLLPGKVVKEIQSTASPRGILSMSALPMNVGRPTEARTHGHSRPNCRTLAAPASIDAKPPIMVGEFQDEQEHDCAMLVNLSLERSANIKISTVKSYATKQVFSAEDGRLLALDEDNGYWLLAGHGLLIKLE